VAVETPDDIPAPKIMPPTMIPTGPPTAIRAIPAPVVAALAPPVIARPLRFYFLFFFVNSGESFSSSLF
jgi:hypothetical protein